MGFLDVGPRAVPEAAGIGMGMGMGMAWASEAKGGGTGSHRITWRLPGLAVLSNVSTDPT